MLGPLEVEGPEGQLLNAPQDLWSTKPFRTSPPGDQGGQTGPEGQTYGKTFTVEVRFRFRGRAGGVSKKDTDKVDR